MTLPTLSPVTTRIALLVGAVALLLFGFIELTEEVFEDPALAELDLQILMAFEALRRPWLNGVAVDVTALGSYTQMVIVSVVSLVILIGVRDYLSAAQFLAAALGALLLVELTKRFIERARPTAVERLVEVASFSYPSGHSVAAAAVYLTLAFLGMRHLPTTAARAALLVCAVALITLVGLSRVYLGVHYPTDVAAGLCLGTAWALLVLAGVSWAAQRLKR